VNTNDFALTSETYTPAPIPKAIERSVPTWAEILASEREAPYFKSILEFIENERKAGKVIFPANSDIFNAIKFTPFDQIKVVVIGQDPYHGPGQAHGLSFSVRPGVASPPSLVNIFKEVRDDLGLLIPNSGCLEPWAKQGVLLLNAVLTVESGKPQSHADIGWEKFTDAVVSAINTHLQGIIFLLWGSPAQKKGATISRERHHVLKAPHPSPLSAHRGFMGCKHFSQANALLEQQGKTPIDWQI
jgi:uracil-DNA glycosylase